MYGSSNYATLNTDNNNCNEVTCCSSCVFKTRSFEGLGPQMLFNDAANFDNEITNVATAVFETFRQITSKQKAMTLAFNIYCHFYSSAHSAFCHWL